MELGICIHGFIFGWEGRGWWAVHGRNVRNKQTNEKMSECDKCYEGDTCYEGWSNKGKRGVFWEGRG